LRRIREYIADFNPPAFERVAQRIVEVSDSLGEFSDRGRAVARGIRQVTTVYPYLLRYRVTDSKVVILRVRHGARIQD
jgi:plasmid stabilization system protein ParE